MIQADKILKSLRLTEKSNLQSAEVGQYTFEVFKDANKYSIKAAVEKVFDVSVTRVNVINQKGKPARNRKTGRSNYKSDYKKAIITLKNRGHDRNRISEGDTYNGYYQFQTNDPTLRFAELQKRDITQKRPEKKLTTSYSKSAGRNCYGRVTSRRRGGGHKRLLRIVDFRRNKFDIPANVQAIEYDPGRTAHIALVAYADGEKRYIIAPEGLKVGDKVLSSEKMISFDIGNTMPLEFIPPSTRLHAVELLPGKGAQLARSAGNSLELINIEGSHAQLKMPSGEVRLVSKKCLATIGSVSNAEHSKVVIGKAGRNRWKGKRLVFGVLL